MLVRKKKQRLFRSTVENVRLMLRLSMPSRQIRRLGKIVTIVQVHPAWRRREPWLNVSEIAAELPELNR
jgi:hypothetical protein